MIEMDWWTGGQQSNSQVFQDDDESTRDTVRRTLRGRSDGSLGINWGDATTWLLARACERPSTDSGHSKDSALSLLECHR